ncbi:MAG: RNA polymerase factor sigma-54 [candidate division WOR-3 bacterium]
MNLEQRIEHRLEQKLTPQLILNLKLLSLPLQELKQTIEQELQLNPVLEEAEEPSVEEEASDETLTSLLSESDLQASSDEFTPSELLPSDSDDAIFISTSQSGEVPALGPGFDEETLSFSSGQALRESLLPKLLAELPLEDAPVAEQVLDYLDDDGRLILSEQELLDTLKVKEDQLQRILKTLRRLPPGGIGCSTTREVLLMQLQLHGVPPDSVEYRLVSEGWEMLLEGQYSKLAQLLQGSQHQVQEALKRLKKVPLDPRPGRYFLNTPTTYISPEFSIEWQGERLAAISQDDPIPRIRIAKRYREILQNPKAYPPEEVNFARQKVKNALMLLKAIESRRRLMRRLVELILQTQQEFFLHGGKFLKPATLKEAARQLGVSPSTLSRAIAGKYIETHFGIFPLKYFFKTGKAGRARTGIKERIKEIIESEDKTSPISDEELCTQLGKEGMEISRRTVAKYRTELGIPPAALRRRAD